MSQDGLPPPRLTSERLPGPIGRTVGGLAWGLAVVGGVLLVASAILTVLSVSGRALLPLGLGPVPGDFELVQMGVGLAIFAFLPLCQLRRGHVTVDILVLPLGKQAMAVTDLIGNLLMTVATAILLWRLYAGFQDKLAYNESTFILRLPLWWFYLPATACLVAALVVCVYTVRRSVAEVAAGGRQGEVKGS